MCNFTLLRIYKYTMHISIAAIAVYKLNCINLEIHTNIGKMVRFKTVSADLEYCCIVNILNMMCRTQFASADPSLSR